jgi:hypothetical protein
VVGVVDHFQLQGGGAAGVRAAAIWSWARTDAFDTKEMRGCALARRLGTLRRAWWRDRRAQGGRTAWQWLAGVVGAGGGIRSETVSLFWSRRWCIEMSGRCARLKQPDWYRGGGSGKCVLAGIVIAGRRGLRDPTMKFIGLVALASEE